MARTTEKHSNVYYTLNNPVGDGSRTNTGFTPHDQAVGVKNNFGADMFKLYGCVYDGKTGLWLFNVESLPKTLKLYDGKPGDWAAFIKRFREERAEIAGEALQTSPRYTNPGERKADVFPKPENDGGHADGKHSNVYYTFDIKSREFTAREKTVGVKNNFGADIFTFDGKVYDGKTGGNICGEANLPELLKKYDGKPDDYNRDIERGRVKMAESVTAEFSLSPRYTRPGERKADVFPKPEKDGSHILSPALYQKGKSWFTRVYNENGVALYKEDKSKSSLPTLFTPCKGCMIGIGADIENVVAFLIKEGFNMYDYLVEQFEKGLANPYGYADIGIGEFLGRRDEAINHNAPIREARYAENFAESNRREAAKRAESARLLQEYKTTIQDAERAILTEQSVTEQEISAPSADGTYFTEKSLMLQLFRENGVELPLKTQGWVKKSLAEIYYRPEREAWSYRYMGGKGDRGSATFSAYVGELAAAVAEKYRAAEHGTDGAENTANRKFEGYGLERFSGFNGFSGDGEVGDDEADYGGGEYDDEDEDDEEDFEM